MAGNAATVDHATATIKASHNTDDEKIVVGTNLSTTAKASADWSKAPDVQAGVAKIDATTGSLKANKDTVKNIRAQLRAAEGLQRKYRRQWNGALQQTLSAMTVFADGSAEVIVGMGGDVVSRSQQPTDVTPDNAHGIPVKESGQAGFQWDKGTTKRGWVVQWATNQNDPTTFSPLIAWTKRKYVLSAQKSGTVLYFRVAYQSSKVPEGHGPFSVWIAATVK